MYAIMETLFDIAFAVLTLSQFTNNHSSKHISAVKHLFWYFKKYPSLGIIYIKNKPLLLYRYIDSNWTIDLITQYSSISFFFILASGIVNASSKCQYLISLSSTKAKYVSKIYYLLSSYKRSSLASTFIKKIRPSFVWAYYLFL